jgi:two-component system LytT family response regulator/two-component system response regulator LytT
MTRPRPDRGHSASGAERELAPRDPLDLPLQALLVDDEQLARDELNFLLGQVGGVEVIGQAGNGVEALASIERLRPDLVFLDIQMPGLNGFEVVRRLIAQGTPSHVVFVTAFDQHAIEAFEVNAVDYLLKPVDAARLELALVRARRRISADRHMQEDRLGPGPWPHKAGPGLSKDQLERIVQLVTERSSRRERLAVKVGERFLLVQADEIIYASLADESITVVTAQHTGLASYRTLDELQARLDPDVFWRVHRSHLVNINKIKEIVPWFSRNYILRMKDEKATEIPVSRAQTRRLREYLKL